MEQASSQHENTLIAEPIDWSDVQSLWAAIRSNNPVCFIENQYLYFVEFNITLIKM